MTPPKTDPIKYCAYCQKLMNRKRYNGTLESNNIFRRRKFCDQTCMAKSYLLDMNELTRSAVQRRIERFKKLTCERCGGNRRLVVHHVDGNWKNNEPSNFQTLCTRCHTREHAMRGDLNKSKRPTVFRK